MPAFPLYSSFARTPSGLTRKSPVSRFYSSQTLTRVRNPRNVRASWCSGERDNPWREIIYPGEIWAKKKERKGAREKDREEKLKIGTYGGPFRQEEQADKFIWMRPRVLVILKIEFAAKFPSRFLGSVIFFFFSIDASTGMELTNRGARLEMGESLKVRSLTIGGCDTRS